MHNNRRGSRYNQPPVSVSGYFNPEALEASEHLTSVSLDTICKEVNQIKTMLNNGEANEASAFWFQVFLPQVNATYRQLKHTAYQERLKRNEQQQRSSSEGGRTSSQISSQLPSDPRQLRRLQDEIQTRIQNSERGTSA